MIDNHKIYALQQLAGDLLVVRDELVEKGEPALGGAFDDLAKQIHVRIDELYAASLITPNKP